MLTHKKVLAVLLAALVWNFPISGKVKKGQKEQGPRVEVTGSAPVVLWREPTDISTRDLYYGPGGKKHEPHGEMTFVEEDLAGSNPKFVVRDEDGVKWKVKLGIEAQPETVASRLVWAVGFNTNEDYFVTDLHVREMPAHLQRGQKLVDADGTVHNVRLKRHSKGEEKTGEWRWRDNPFRENREFNGLRVMMALINNWDLKDINNAIYQRKKSKDKDKESAKDDTKDGASQVAPDATDGEAKDGTNADKKDETGGGKKHGTNGDKKQSTEPEGPSEAIYVVTDLGASFGSTGLNRTHELSKNNLAIYTRSKFITRVTKDYVDFETPRRPALIVMINPHEFFSRLELRWIGHRIPRADARWMGQLLAQLSPTQIREAFRAAGYSQQEIDGFATVLQDRIAQLNRL